MTTEPATAAPGEHRPGDLIAGRYALSHKLGAGGMGFVWVARSLALDVDVALKVMRPEIAGTEAVERMAREARTAAQLGHPAMVRVLDFGSTDKGEPFLVMELLQGEELQALLLREQRLDPERAAALLLPVIDGLGTAHQKGIVHRDIKPANIFIASDSNGRIQPKLLDFGIAKLQESHSLVSTRLTQMGAVLGSPQYLSPEQAEGLEDVDGRADIWSVGVLLYELVTGEPPFTANNYNALIRVILNDTPKPTTELGVGDEQFWTIIERCLKKDPQQRWSSMWELGEALALWLFERGVRVDAAARSLKHDWLEGGVSGLQILVDSEAPPPSGLAAPGSVEPFTVAAASARSLAATQIKPRRRPLAAALTGLGLASGALLLLALWKPFSPHRAPVAPQAEHPPSAAVAAPVALPAASAPVPSPVVEASSSAPETAAPASAEPVSASAPSAGPTPHGVQGAVRRPAPARPAPARPAPARKSLNTEFGF